MQRVTIGGTTPSTELTPGAVGPARSGWRAQASLMPWVYLLPCTLFLLVMSAYPTVYAFYLSLTDAKTSLDGASFLGLANYITLIHDPNWWQALGVTVLFVVAAVGVEVVLGFLLALWLNETPGGNGLMTLFILPLAMSPVVVGYMFQYMYDGQLGLITFLFGKIGIRVDLIANIHTVVPAIIAVDIWEWTPFSVLIFLAALKAVSNETLEAARMDGATFWQTVLHVMVPLVQSSAAVVLLFRVLDATKVFDIIYVMTAGGPARSSEAVSLFITESAFQNINMGYAAATSFVILIIAVVTTRVLARLASVGVSPT